MEYDVVFEGGGAKGICFLGAMAELEARGHQVARIVGTSAGAIFASLIAVGYDARTARDVVARRDEQGVLLLNRFLDPPGALPEPMVEGSELLALMDAVDLPLLGEGAERRINRTLLRGLLHAQSMRQVFLFMERGGFYEGISAG